MGHMHSAEPRVGSMGEGMHPSSHMYAGKRRSSDEGKWKVNEQLTEQRRKSAEPLVSEKDPKKEPKGSRSHRNHRKQPQHSQSSNETKARINTMDSGSTEDLLESSQCWDSSINTTDITIILQDEDKDRARSASSSSTLIESAEDSPPEVSGETKRLTKAQLKQQDLSQEPFEDDDDHKDMMSLSGFATGPTQVALSNYPHYYDSTSYFGEHQENYPPSHTTSKQDLTHGLSQPTYPSPPKSRHGKSLTDLTGSNMSLTSSHQFLSQSAVDFHMHDLHPSPRHMPDNRRMHDHRFRPSYGPHMSSDPHLNYIPGLQKSVLSALSDVKEEVEQKKARGKKFSPSSSHQIQRAASQQYHSRHPQHKAAKLNQRHLRATVVEGNKEARGSPHNKR